MDYTEVNGNIEVIGLGNFDLNETLDCGQCFRFESADENSYRGVIGKNILKLSFTGGKLILENTDLLTFENIYLKYFDLDRDYEKIKQSYLGDKALYAAVKYCGGIRLLRQDSFETLISFIISQNNNIKRIKGIISRLCENFGEPIEEGFYTFPSPEKLASADENSLAVIRSGFRAKYILDAAKKVASGEVDLAQVEAMPLEEALRKLMEIKGVGLKVANCVLLYGFGRIDAFPVDVWMKKALSLYYSEGFPTEFYETRGIAQQYLFHFIRNQKT